MGVVLGLIWPLRLVVAAVIHVVWRQRFSLPSSASSLVMRFPPLRAALPWCHRDSAANVLHWNVNVQLLCNPCRRIIIGGCLQ